MGFGERSVNTKRSKQTSRVKSLTQSHTFLTRELDLRMVFFVQPLWNSSFWTSYKKRIWVLKIKPECTMYQGGQHCLSFRVSPWKKVCWVTQYTEVLVY